MSTSSTTVRIPLTRQCPLDVVYNNMLPLAEMLGLTLTMRPDIPSLQITQRSLRADVGIKHILVSKGTSRLEALIFVKRLEPHIGVASSGNCRVEYSPEDTKLLADAGIFPFER